MNSDMIAAVLRLQGSLLDGRMPNWRAEQTEEALNCLLSVPDRTGDPFHLERNAMSDARKKLRRRATLFADHVAELNIADAGGRRGGGEPYDIVHVAVADVVARLGGGDREILQIALEGGESAEIGAALHVSTSVAKVRLSRARGRARRAWAHA